MSDERLPISERIGWENDDVTWLAGKPKWFLRMLDRMGWKYSDDEPRDDDGRWTSGGGGPRIGFMAPDGKDHVANGRDHNDIARDVMGPDAGIRDMIKAGYVRYWLRNGETNLNFAAGREDTAHRAMELLKENFQNGDKIYLDIMAKDGYHEWAGHATYPKFYEKLSEANRAIRAAGGMDKSWKYSADEPRDEHGRWTSGGDGGSIFGVTQAPDKAHEEAKTTVLSRGHDDDNEHGGLVDRNTGNVSYVTNGSHDSIVITENSPVRDPKQNIDFVHNHPESDSLSPDDLNILVDAKGAHSVTAVTADGGIYTATRADGTPADWKVMSGYSGVANALVRHRFEDAVGSGKLTTADAGAVHWEAVNRSLAKAGLLGYASHMGVFAQDVMDRKGGIVNAAISTTSKQLRKLVEEHRKPKGMSKMAVRPDGAWVIDDSPPVYTKPKYSPDQPRDDHGRWSAEGDTAATVNTDGALIGKPASQEDGLGPGHDVGGMKIGTAEGIPHSYIEGSPVDGMTPQLLPKSYAAGVEAALKKIEATSPSLAAEMKQNVTLIPADLHRPGLQATTLSTGRGSTHIVLNTGIQLRENLPPDRTVTAGIVGRGDMSDPAFASKLVEHIVLHEAGHVLDARMAQGLGDMMVTALMEAPETSKNGHIDGQRAEKFLHDNLSQYAVMGGPHETVAELYHKFVLGKPLPHMFDPMLEAFESADEAGYKPRTHKSYSGTGWDAWANAQPDDVIIYEPTAKSARFLWLGDDSFRDRFIWADFNPDEPRDDHGRWTDGPGGESSQPPSAASNPEHQRLEGEASVGTAALDQLLPTAIANAEYEGRGPVQWSDLSKEQQSEVKQAYMADKEEQYQNNGTFYPDESTQEDLFKNDTSRPEMVKMTNEASSQVAGLMGHHVAFIDHGMFGDMHIPIDRVSLDEAISAQTLDSEPIQLDLSGVKTSAGHDLTEAQQKAVQNSFNVVWPDVYGAAKQDWLDTGPDALMEWQQDRINDAVQRDWDGMDETEAFGWGKEHDVFTDVSPKAISPGAPTVWVWQTPGMVSGESQGDNYARTGAIARELTNLRTTQLMQERGVAPPAEGTDVTVRPGDLQETVWTAWKDTSQSGMGLALQLAIENELGGVGRLTSDQKARAMKAAGDSFAPELHWSNKQEEERVGMARLQAYVRAQWETAQYVLQKAGTSDVDAYRAVYLNTSDAATAQTHQPNPNHYGNYTYYPELKVQRNGAQSFTTKASVANNWDGVGVMPTGASRVVLRAHLPRTSIFSLPVFGHNLYNEEEVVVSGTKEPWTWDAWSRTAPDPKEVPFSETHKHKAAALVIDFAAIEPGGSWLNPKLDAGGKPVLPKR